MVLGKLKIKQGGTVICLPQGHYHTVHAGDCVQINRYMRDFAHLFV